MARRRLRIVSGEEAGPWHRLLLVAGVVLAAAVAGWLAFSLFSHDISDRYIAATSDRERLLALRRELAAELRDQRAENERMREKLVYLEKSQQIDREACDQLRASLREAQRELLEVQEQLAFYRGIVSPDGAKGVRVHDLLVRQVNGEARFELILMQADDKGSRTRGRLRMVVDGRIDGEKATHIVRGPDGEADMLFSFRHFQEFSGDLGLPGDFEPQQVRLTLRDGAGEAAPEITYEWQRLLVKED